MALRKVETIVAFIFVSLLSFLPVKNSLKDGKFIAVPLLLVSEHLFSAQIIFSKEEKKYGKMKKYCVLIHPQTKRDGKINYLLIS